MTMPLPVVVIGGYLGAGKTTLVNHLLRHAGGRRIAVLVNDFGEISIDAGLIESSEDGPVLALAGGCICCSYGADLVGTLAAVAARQPAPDLVLIETSGVALPAAVARTARLAAGIEIEGIVVLADARTLRAQAGDRYVGDTVAQQLQAAQIVLLNKCDAVDAEDLAATDRWLRETLPKTVLLRCEQARVPAEVVLGLHAAPDDEAAAGPGPRWAETRWSNAGTTLAHVFVHQAWQVPIATPLQHVLDALDALAGRIVRAKGWLRDVEGRTWLLQAVGDQRQLVPASPPRAAWLNRLQLIGLKGLGAIEAPAGWLPAADGAAPSQAGTAT